MTVEISVLSPDTSSIGPRRSRSAATASTSAAPAPRPAAAQVAVEHDLDRERFLAATCRKAGLAADAWQDGATEIRVFEAEVFGDQPDAPRA